MGLSFFNQRRAREAEKAKVAMNVTPAPVEEEIKPVEVEEEIQPVEVEEEVQKEAPKRKKTDAEKLKRKNKDK